VRPIIVGPVLSPVPVPPRHVGELIEPAGEEAIERLRAAASALSGARILELNSTNFGGGVAELLFSQVGLMIDLGLHTEWRVMGGHEDFFAVTKAVHNALQGAEIEWTPQMQETYLKQNRENAAAWSEDYDFVIVHDPQPAAMLAMLEEEGRRKGKWAWRCHIDLSNSYQPVWDYYAQWVSRYDAAVFTMGDFVRPGFEGPEVFLVPPSIDPLSTKNCWIGDRTSHEVLVRYGIDARRPIVTQVSRFDPWKDPLGVIDAYRLVKESVPAAQLVMVASMAQDDPEGLHYLELTEEHRAGDPDVFLLSNLQGVGNLEVNAIQRESTVIVQKSIREGFGLVVSEGMWKERPVVGGNTGGIRLQIEDGVSGFLVDSVEQCAARVGELLADPALRATMGRVAHERVKNNFLTPREIEDYLRMLAAL
jgi:trehalose synthase